MQSFIRIKKNWSRIPVPLPVVSLTGKVVTDELMKSDGTSITSMSKWKSCIFGFPAAEFQSPFVGSDRHSPYSSLALICRREQFMQTSVVLSCWSLWICSTPIVRWVRAMTIRRHRIAFDTKMNPSSIFFSINWLWMNNATDRFFHRIWTHIYRWSNSDWKICLRSKHHIDIGRHSNSNRREERGIVTQNRTGEKRNPWMEEERGKERRVRSGPTMTNLLIQLKKIPGRFLSTKNLFWLVEKINENFPSPRQQSIDHRNETMEDISSTERERESTWRMDRQRTKIRVLCSLKRERRTGRDSSLSTTRGGNCCKWIFRSVGEWRSVCTLDQSKRNSSQWNDESILSGYVMSTIIVEHRHIVRSIARKRWRCRESLSSDRLRSVGQWGVVSLRARPSGQSLWHCPGSNCHGDDRHTSIDRWTDALSSQWHRINFGSKSKKRPIDERQGEQSRSWFFIRHQTKANPRTLFVERGGDRWTFLLSQFNARERERNRWWFRFWTKRDEWSHRTACRRSKRDEQLKKRSVIRTFAHGGSMGREGFACHVASEGWSRWRDFRRVTGSTGDIAVGGEMNRIVVECCTQKVAFMNWID